MKYARARLSFAIVGLGLGSFAVQSAQAVNATWNGTTDNVWATGTNWTATPIPGTGNIATFNNAGGAVDVIDLGAGVTINTVLFDTTAAAYTIGSGAVGSQTLTMNSGGAITMNATVANNQVFNSIVNTNAGTVTITNNSVTNSLTFAADGTYTVDQTLNIAGAGTTNWNGDIIDNEGTRGRLTLTKTGAGALNFNFTGSSVELRTLNLNSISTVTLAGGTTLAIDNNGAGNIVSSTGGTITGGTINLSAESDDIGTANGTTLNINSLLTGGTFELFRGGSATGVTVLGNAGNTYSVLQLNEGILSAAQFGNKIDATGFLGTDDNIAFGTGNATLRHTGAAETSNKDFVFGANGVIDSAGGGITISGILSGGGAVTKAGASTLTLSNANTHSGTTTVNAGTLNLSNALALQNSALVTTGAGTITLTGVTTPTFGGLSGATGNLATIISSGYGGVTNLTLNPAGSFVYGGVIANGAAGMTLTKTGGGTQILSGANTYTGATIVNAGTLQLGNGGTTGSLNTVSTLTFAGGTGLNINQSDTVTQGVDFNVGPFSGHNVVLTKSGTGNVVLTGANQIRQLNLNNASNSIDIGATSLSIGNGGGNTITSTTGGTINGTGTITISTGGGTNYGDNSTANGTTLTINPRVTGTAANGFEYCCTAGGTIFLANNANDFGGQVFINVAGTIRTSSINNIGVASGLGLGNEINLNANGANLDYVGTGSTTNRTVVLGNNFSTSITQSGASGNLLFNGTFSGSAGTKTLTLQGSTAGTGEISSIIGNGSGGTQAIAKSGTGTWTLSGNNTFTGGVTVNAGTLRVGNAGALNSGTPNAVLMNGGTLQLNGNSIAVGGLSAATAGTVQNANAAPATLTVNQASNATFAGLLQDGAGGGALSLVKSGAGVLTLLNSNTYTGATTISGGTLRLGAATSNPVAGAIYNLDATNLASLFQNGAGTIPVTATGQPVGFWADALGSVNDFSQGTAANQPVYTTGGINGLPAVVFDGAASPNNDKLVLGTATSARTVFIVDRPIGTLNGLDGIFGINNVDTGIRAASTTSWQNPGNGNDFSNAAGSQFFINGAAGNSFGVANSPHLISVVRGANLAMAATAIGDYFSGGTRSYQGAIGEVLVYTTALTDAQRADVDNYLRRKWLGLTTTNALPTTTAVNITASGATLDLNGTLQTIASLAGVSGSSVTNGAATIPTTLTINPAAGTFNFAGVISDSGVAGALSIVKTGAGTQVLSGINTYNGTTTVNDGTLRVNGSLAAGSAVTVNSGGTLGGTGTINGTVLINAGGFHAAGNSIGTQNVGAYTQNGTEQVELGTAGPTPAAGLSDRTNVTGNLTLGGASVLQLIDNAGADGNGSVGAGAYRIIDYTGTRSGTFASVTNPTSLLAEVVYNDAETAVDLNMFNHGNASFASPIDTDNLTVNIGAFLPGSGLHNVSYDIHNLLQTLNFTAEIDLVNILLTTPDELPLSTNLATFNNLAAGSFLSFNATLDAAFPSGVFSETYLLTFHDSAGYNGANLIQTLTLTINGEILIIPEPATATLGLLAMGGLMMRRRRTGV